MTFRAAPTGPPSGWAGIFTALLAVPVVVTMVLNIEPSWRVTLTVMTQPEYQANEVPFPKPIGLDTTLKIIRPGEPTTFEIARGGTATVDARIEDDIDIEIEAEVECSSISTGRSQTEGIAASSGDGELDTDGLASSIRNQSLEPSESRWVTAFRALISVGLAPAEETDFTYYLNLAGRVKEYSAQWEASDVTCKPVSIIPAAER